MKRRFLRKIVKRNSKKYTCDKLLHKSLKR
nr:MAG TPA: hypothetical protein [Caudoviricetes sp.]